MIEEWRSLPGGYSGAYEVSSQGRIRSLTRRVRVKGVNNFRTIRGQLIKPRLNRGGYLQVSLSVGKKSKTHLVHRLVCIAFHGEPPEGKPLVLHGDGVRTHNTPDNLRWGDYSDNNLDSVRHGTDVRHNALKTHCPKGHKYDPENTYVIPSTGGRVCITCKKDNSRRAWLKIRKEGNA